MKLIVRHINPSSWKIVGSSCPSELNSLPCTHYRIGHIDLNGKYIVECKKVGDIYSILFNCPMQVDLSSMDRREHG